jgi:RsiW-degrading membrane proteinase PrsW (M82 family)
MTALSTPRTPQPPAAALAFCSRCGQRLDAWRFCPRCGAEHGQPELSLVPARPPAAQYLLPPGSDVRIRDLISIAGWLRSGTWYQGWLGLFLAFAVAPFVLLQATKSDADVRHAAWGFSIYFAVIWLIAIHGLVKPEPVSLVRLSQIIGLTAVIGVSVAITIERHLAANTTTLARSIFTVGFPEELVKALPLLLLLATTRSQIRPRTYLYLGAVSGLAFGVVESVAYTALYSDGIYQTGDTSLVTGIIWRLLTDSLFHAAMAGIVGVFIGFAALLQRHQIPLVAGGLSFAAVLHGTYDRTAGGWFGTLVAVVVMFVFVGYVATSDDLTT